MTEPTFVLNIKYGTVEIQSRLIFSADGMAGQSRKIERDRNGVIELTTDWENTGLIVKFS